MDYKHLSDIDFQNLTSQNYLDLSSLVSLRLHCKGFKMSEQSKEEIAHFAIIYLIRFYKREKASIGAYIDFAILKAWEERRKETNLFSKEQEKKGYQQTPLYFVNEEGEEVDIRELPYYDNTDELEKRIETNNMEYLIACQARYFEKKYGTPRSDNLRNHILLNWKPEFFRLLARKSKREINRYFHYFYFGREGKGKYKKIKWAKQEPDYRKKIFKKSYSKNKKHYYEKHREWVAKNREKRKEWQKLYMRKYREQKKKENGEK